MRAHEVVRLASRMLGLYNWPTSTKLELNHPERGRRHDDDILFIILGSAALYSNCHRKTGAKRARSGGIRPQQRALTNYTQARCGPWCCGGRQIAPSSPPDSMIGSDCQNQECSSGCPATSTSSGEPSLSASARKTSHQFWSCAKAQTPLMRHLSDAPTAWAFSSRPERFRAWLRSGEDKGTGG